MSIWYVSLIQTNNNGRRSAIEQTGSNLCLPASINQSVSAYWKLASPSSSVSDGPGRRTQFVSKSPTQKARVQNFKGVRGYGRNHLLKRKFVFHGVHVLGLRECGRPGQLGPSAALSSNAQETA